ncbi:hypothetical protein FOL46_001481 [Perkinsus olseni]|uniref:Protein arginine methyltransferase 10 n=1 Tax=Perkinsus olseni TaxID=32597 RepID=A0A7J6MCR2_PEROL|nr:hypothetical protein FOL46_001481 [Perkinsus olseni]
MTSLLWWTQSYDADDLNADGTLIQSSSLSNTHASSKQCGQRPPESTIFRANAVEDVYTSSPMQLRADEDATLPSIGPWVEGGKTLALCYCPDYDTAGAAGGNLRCDTFHDFIQPIGYLYLFTISICDAGDVSCSTKYYSIIPMQEFLLRIDCPPAGGCSSTVASDESRIKFVYSSAAAEGESPLSDDNNIPNWSPSSPCKTTVASSSSTTLLSDNGDERTTTIDREIWSNVEYRYDGTNALGGGSRADYKVWSSPNIDPLGAIGTEYTIWSPRLAVPLGEWSMVCYCNENCDQGASWFQVGYVYSVNEIGLASSNMYCTICSAKSKIKAIRYANKPGTIALYSGGSASSGYHDEHILPSEGPRFAGHTTIFNVISYDIEAKYPSTGGSLVTLEESSGYHTAVPNRLQWQHTLDKACKMKEYDSNILSGISSQDQAKQYAAVKHCAEVTTGASTSSTTCTHDVYLPFTSESNDKTLRILIPGTMVVCYCSHVTAQKECVSDEYWYAGNIFQVRGPWKYPGGDALHWEVPIGRTFALTVARGWGLGLHRRDGVYGNYTARWSQDHIRILSSGGRCTSSDYNPRGTAIGFKVGCPSTSPESCTEVTSYHNIPLYTYRSKDDPYLPRILKIDASRLGSTVLHFNGSISSIINTGDLILLDPDIITIGGKSSIATSGGSTLTPLERWRIYKLAGRGPYADTLKGMLRGDPDESCGSNSDCNDHITGHRVTVLSSTTVSIPIGFGPSDPEFAFNMSGVHPTAGHWEIHSKAWTRKSLRVVLMIITEVVRQRHQYYSQVGTLTIVNPPSMRSVKLFLTTSMEGAIQPAVLSFTPGHADEALRHRESYPKARLQLRIVFSNLDVVEPYITSTMSPLLAKQQYEGLLGPNASISNLSTIVSATSNMSSPFPREEEVPASRASVSICGDMFTELWSSAVSSGFPMPSGGCHYTRSYYDIPVDSSSTEVEDKTPYREFILRFHSDDASGGPDPQPLLRDSCEGADGTVGECRYQLAFNVKVSQRITSGQSHVHIYYECVDDDDSGACGVDNVYTEGGSIYRVFDHGSAATSLTTKSPPSEMTHARWDMHLGGGITIVGTDHQPDGVLDLTPLQGARSHATANFTINLAGSGILSTSRLVLHLWPVTQWNLPTTGCRMNCSMHAPHSCGYPTCQFLSLTEHTGSNAISVAFDLRMPPILLNNTCNLTFHDITLPMFTGLFPTRIAAEISDGDGLHSDFITSKGLLFLKPSGLISTIASHAVGTLLKWGVAGYGSMPFEYDRDNILYVRLRIPSTLRQPLIPLHHDGLPLPRAAIELKLPHGYACSVADSSVKQGMIIPDLFIIDSTQHHFTQLPPPHGGVWSSNITNPCCSNICRYTLADGFVLFAGTIVYVPMAVRNPPDPLPKSSPSNFWTVSFTSNGQLTAIHTVSYNITNASTLYNMSMSNMSDGGISTLRPDYSFHDIPFLTLEYEDETFAGNVGVLESTPYATLQPLTGMGWVRGHHPTRWLALFFKVRSRLGMGSSIILEAPIGFDFSHPCHIDRIPERYITTTDGNTAHLPPTTTCTGMRRGNYLRKLYNDDNDDDRKPIAEIKVAEFVEGNNARYAFTIEVSNPEVWTVSQHYQWRLYVADHNGYIIEGTPWPIPSTWSSNYYLLSSPLTTALTTQGYHQRSWAVYENLMPTAVYYAEGVEAMLPYHYRGGISSTLSVYPIIITSNIDTETSIRITAPPGYIWEFQQDDDIRYGPPNTPDADHHIHTIPGPPPTIQNSYRQLVWEEVVLVPDVVYGFSHRVRVPDNDPIDGLNSYVLEVGYYYRDAYCTRHGVGTMDAGSIRVINNMYIDYLTDVASYSHNTIDIVFTLVTGLPPGGGIIIRANDLAQGLLIEGNTIDDFFTELSGTCIPLENIEPGFSALPPTAVCEIIPRRKHPAWSSRLSPSSDLGGGDNRAVYGLIIVITAAAGGDGNTRLLDDDEASPHLHSDGTIQPGRYKLRFKCKNPDTLTNGDEILWTIESYYNIGEYPSGGASIADTPASAPGLPINAKMNEAFIIDDAAILTPTVRSATGRDDRPGKRNEILIAFGFTSGGSIEPSQTLPSELIVKAPIGFTISQDCITDITVDSTTVFGDADYWPSWSSSYQRWPNDGTARILGCKGGRNTASITISPGLQANGKKYVLRIAVMSVSYPIPHDQNLWVVSLRGKQSSLPFPGYRLSTFTDITLVSASTAATLLRPIDDDSDGRALTITLVVGSKSIQADRKYTLRGYVYNPYSTVESSSSTSLQWTMQSFTPSAYTTDDYHSPARLLREPLDEATLDGYPINEALVSFHVNNVNNEFNGEAKVKGLTISITFTHPLMDGDLVSITTPYGYDLREDQSTSDDDGDDTRCFETYQVLEYKTPAFPDNEPMLLVTTVINPTKSPIDPIDNYWEARHERDGIILSSEVYQSWDILPQLLDLEIHLLGPYLSAGSRSSIKISFVPVSSADTLDVEALFPPGTAFDRATISHAHRDPVNQEEEEGGADWGLSILASHTIAAKIAFTDMNLEPGRRVEITLENVKLASMGGQTIFTFTTYAGSDISMGNMRDEKVAFRGGYFQPGALTVLSTQLMGIFRVLGEVGDDDVYPVERFMRPRVDAETSMAVFEFEVMTSAKAGSRLIVKSEGDDDGGVGRVRQSTSVQQPGGEEGITPPLVDISFYDLDQFPNTWRSLGIDTPVVLGPHEASITVLSPDNALSATSLASTDVMVLGVRYRLQMEVLPHPGDNSWRLDVQWPLQSTSQVYPVNTNDGLTEAFAGDSAPVLPLELNITTSEVPPPYTWIEVSITINGLYIPPNRLASTTLRAQIIIPTRYELNVNGCGQGCELESYTWGDLKRQVATLTFTTRQQQITGAEGRYTVKMTVRTPTHTPEDNTWYLIAHDSSEDDDIIGWGDGPGFDIVPLEGFKLIYPPIGGTYNQPVAITMIINRPNRVYSLDLRPPKGYSLQCSSRFYPITLPTSTQCITDSSKDRQRWLTMGGLSEPLQSPMSLIFLLSIDIPVPSAISTSGDDNSFDILLRDKDGAVVDGAFAVPVPYPPLPDGPFIIEPFIGWTNSEPNTASIISLGFTLQQSTRAISAILLVFPDMFVHEIQKATSVRSLNKRFPKRPQEWVDFSRADQLKVLVDDTQFENLPLDRIPGPDTYQFSFPVLIPSSMPSHNVWYIIMCSSPSSECNDFKDADHILATIPLPGFEFGQVCGEYGSIKRAPGVQQYGLLSSLH